ncbi:MAG TPA: hypothetical protein VF416_04450 [Marmoricola sp.]
MTGIDHQPHPETWYEIRVRGHLDDRWTAWFDGLELHHEDDGTTCFRGPVADQAALHGVLERMRGIGLPLVSVVPVDPDGDAPPPSPSTTN